MWISIIFDVCQQHHNVQPNHGNFMLFDYIIAMHNMAPRSRHIKIENQRKKRKFWMFFLFGQKWKWFGCSTVSGNGQ